MGIEWVTLLIGAVIFFGIRAAAGAGVGAILLVTAAALVLLGGGAGGSDAADIRELLNVDPVPASEESSCEWHSGEDSGENGGGLVQLENAGDTPISFRLEAVMGGDLEQPTTELTYPSDNGVFSLGPGESVAKLLKPSDDPADLAGITWCDARMVDIQNW